MKKLVFVILLLVLIGVGYFVSQDDRKSQTTTPSITATPTKHQAFCTSSQLEAAIQSEGAAGNVYDKLTIQNISNTSCQIVGDNMPSIDYPSSVKNFQTSPQGQPSKHTFMLAPNQIIYALVHFPNGPQCSGPVTQVDAMVTYKISQQDSVSFKPQTGTTALIPSCEDIAEVTKIDLYPFSTKEVAP